MAKKTRKEKLAADLRRSRPVVSQNSFLKVGQTPSTVLSPNPYPHVKGDLLKSILLALLILGLELVLYWQLS